MNDAKAPAVNGDIFKNTVRAENQVNEKFRITCNYPDGERVLFLGNSITLHETAPAIGWNHNWGMAASAEKNDYVHLVVEGLEKAGRKINYCVTNVGRWEQNFQDPSVLESFQKARDFAASCVIIRLGENVPPQFAETYGFEQRFDEFVGFFTRAAKKTVITDLFWEHQVLDGCIRRVAKKRSADFVSISDLGYDEKNKAIGLFAHEGVAMHPGDVGMKKIADRILSKLV
ncbi:MAG: hypothetical protein ACI4ST_01030 [Candidatus Gallimonas sp.]